MTLIHAIIFIVIVVVVVVIVVVLILVFVLLIEFGAVCTSSVEYEGADQLDVM